VTVVNRLVTVMAGQVRKRSCQWPAVRIIRPVTFFISMAGTFSFLYTLCAMDIKVTGDSKGQWSTDLLLVSRLDRQRVSFPLFLAVDLCDTGPLSTTSNRFLTHNLLLSFSYASRRDRLEVKKKDVTQLLQKRIS